jgi:cytochrome P450
VFSFWWGTDFCVVVGNPKYSKALNDSSFRPYGVCKVFECISTKEALIFVNGEEYQRRKKLWWSPPLQHKAVEARGEIVTELVENDLMPLWKDCAATGKEIDAFEFAIDTTVKVVNAFLFGAMIKKKEFLHDLAVATDKIWRSLESALWQTNSEDSAEDLEACIAIIRKTCKDLEEERKRKPPKGEKFFIDCLLENEKDPNIVFADIAFMLAAGVHTTACLISWGMYYLTKNPQWQTYVQKELDEKCPGDGPVTHEHIKELNCLKNVIDETLRIVSIVNFQGRGNPKADIEMEEGYVIPKDSLIMISLCQAMRDPGQWKAPGEFWPARFETEDPLRYPLSFSPFGFAGNRICPGKALALLEASEVLGNLLKKYNFRFGEEQVLPVLPKFSVVTVPSTKIGIILVPRV